MKSKAKKPMFLLMFLLTFLLSTSVFAISGSRTWVLVETMFSSSSPELTRVWSDGLAISRAREGLLIFRMRDASSEEELWLKDKRGTWTGKATTLYCDTMKVILVYGEKDEKGSEYCKRGIAFKLMPDGKWESGVYLMRTYGWGTSYRERWGDFLFGLGEGKI